MAPRHLSPKISYNLNLSRVRASQRTRNYRGGETRRSERMRLFDQIGARADDLTFNYGAFSSLSPAQRERNQERINRAAGNMQRELLRGVRNANGSGT